MRGFLKNDHLVTTSAKVIMYCATLVVVGVLFWKAPDQAVQIMNAGVYMLGGAAVGKTMGIIK